MRPVSDIIKEEEGKGKGKGKGKGVGEAESESESTSESASERERENIKKKNCAGHPDEHCDGPMDLVTVQHL